jgi:hypothetical protein
MTDPTISSAFEYAIAPYHTATEARQWMADKLGITTDQWASAEFLEKLDLSKDDPNDMADATNIVTLLYIRVFDRRDYLLTLHERAKKLRAHLIENGKYAPIILKIGDFLPDSYKLIVAGTIAKSANTVVLVLARK